MNKRMQQLYATHCAEANEWRSAGCALMRIEDHYGHRHHTDAISRCVRRAAIATRKAMLVVRGCEVA